MRSSACRRLLFASVVVALGACDGRMEAPDSGIDGMDAGPDAGVDAGPRSAAQVRFAHLVWDAPTVSVWLDERLVVDRLESRSVAPSSGYLDTTSGPHEVAVAPVGEGPEAALLRATLVFEPGAPQTVFSFGTLASSAGLGLSDDTPAAAGRSRGRFVHAATGVGALDLWAGTPLVTFPFARRAEGVAPGTVSGLLLDGAPGGDTEGELSIGLAPSGAAAPSTSARIRSRFGPFTLVALVGDRYAPTHYELIVLTADRVVRVPLYYDLCVAHASALPDVVVRVCRNGGGCYGPDVLPRREAWCMPGGVSLEVRDPDTSEVLASMPLHASHFEGSPLVVLHDRDGAPALSYFALAAGAPVDYGVRLIHVADGWGPIQFLDLGGDGPLGPGLAFGAATDRLLPLARIDATVGADTDADGVSEQRLPLRADASDALEVIAFGESGVLRLARLHVGQTEAMVIVGDVPIGGDCAARPCEPDALCVTLPGQADATCRRTDCPTRRCAMEDTCGVVRTDFAFDPDAGESETLWPICAPRVDVDGDLDARLDVDDATGALRLSIGGEPHLLEHVSAAITTGLRPSPTGVLVSYLDPARAAGGTGWSASLRFEGLPATGRARLELRVGEGPSVTEGWEVFSAEVNVVVHVAPTALEAGQPLSASVALTMGAPQLALFLPGSGE